MIDAEARKNLTFVAHKAQQIADRTRDLERLLSMPAGHQARPSLASALEIIDMLRSEAVFQVGTKLDAARRELEPAPPKPNGTAGHDAVDPPPAAA